MSVVVGRGPQSSSARRPALDRLSSRLLISAAGVQRARRPTDLVRLLFGAVVTAGLGALASAVHVEHVSPLPAWIVDGLQIIVATCLVLIGVALAIVTIVRARWALLLSTVGAGLVAAAVCGLVVPSSQEARLSWLGGAAGALCAAWPEFKRPIRRLTVLGLLCGVVLAGWGQGSGHESTVTLVATASTLAAAYTVGCLFRLVFGVGTSAPLIDLIGGYVGELGVVVEAIAAVDGVRHWTASRFTATTSTGTAVAISIYSRDAVDAQLFGRIMRFLWYRHTRVATSYTRVQHLEHHLALVLRAWSAGVSDEQVIAAGYVGPEEDAAVITTSPTGRTMAEHTADELRDELVSVWSAVTNLAAAGLAHGSIDGGAVMRSAVNANGWVFAGMANGSLAPDEQQVLADRAAILFATARIVGADRAVTSAHTALGQGGLSAIIPLLQIGAFPQAERSRRSEDKSLLAELRRAASAASGIDPPELAPLHRMDPVTALLIAGTFFGVWLLIGELSGLSDVGDVLKSAQWWWLAAAFVVGLTPNLTEAVALSGAVAEPLPLGPLVMLRLADGFLGLVGGTVATTAAAIRFFQRRGLSASIAVTSGLLYSVSGFIDQMLISVVALFFVHDAFTFASQGSSSDGGSSGSDVLWIVLGTLVVVGVGSGIAVAKPRLRHRVLDKVRPQAAAARDDLRTLAGEPGKLIRLFGANVATQVLFAITLGLCLRAFGTTVPLPVLLLVNTAGSLLGGVAPVPGGMGVIESVLIAGLTAAGVEQDTAIAATFAYRLITAYLPPIWGWPAMWWLRRTDYL